MAGEPHDSLQDGGIALEVICPALALIVTVLRVYSRLKINGFGWDDTLIIVAMVLSIAMCVGSVLVMKYLYIGIHAVDTPKVFDLTPGLLWTYIVGAVYNPILAIVKQSILIFLLRLAGTKPGVRTTVWATAIVNAALMIAVFLVVIFQCSPIKSNWDITVKGKCVNQVRFGVSTAALTILTDLVALALPFYIFLDLKIKRKTKIALLFVFLLGLIVTVVSVVRLYFLWVHIADTNNPDPNYSLGFCVSAIEVNLAIITASGPALWPLFRTWMPGLFGSTGASHGYNYGGPDYVQGGPSMDWTPNGTRRRADGTTSKLGGTITSSSRVVAGGHQPSNIALKDMRGDRSWVRLDGDSKAEMGDSDEEFLTQNGPGILRTTRYSVTRDADSARAVSRGDDSTDVGKVPSLGKSASVESY